MKYLWDVVHNEFRLSSLPALKFRKTLFNKIQENTSDNIRNAIYDVESHVENCLPNFELGRQTILIEIRRVADEKHKS